MASTRMYCWGGCNTIYPWPDRMRWPDRTYAVCWSCTMRRHMERLLAEPRWWRTVARRVAVDWRGPWTFASTQQSPVPGHRSLDLLER